MELVKRRTGTPLDTGLIPRCGKGVVSQSQLSVQTLLRCPYTPVCAIECIKLRMCARTRSCSPCQNSVVYGNTKTTSMHRRLGSETLPHWAFHGKATRISYGRNPNETIHCTNKKNKTGAGKADRRKVEQFLAVGEAGKVSKRKLLTILDSSHR